MEEYLISLLTKRMAKALNPNKKIRVIIKRGKRLSTLLESA